MKLTKAANNLPLAVGESVKKTFLRNVFSQTLSNCAAKIILNYRKALAVVEDRVLRKQSGGLFLMSLRKLTFRLVEGKIEMSANRAAMFGLDARIALAIFGALSVISGAALYSAIQSARVTALHTELNEIGKAFEQFYLDTGQDLEPYLTTNPHRNYKQTTGLIESRGVNGWKGPYLSYLADTTLPNLLVYPKNDNGINNHIHVLSLNDNTWSAWSPAGECTTVKDCYIWVSIYGFSSSDEAILKALDIRIDGADDNSNGNFRYILSPNYAIYLKYMPLDRPY